MNTHRIISSSTPYSHFIMLLLLLTVVACGDDAPPGLTGAELQQALELEQQVLEYRQQIRTIEAVVDLRIGGDRRRWKQIQQGERWLMEFESGPQQRRQVFVRGDGQILTRSQQPDPVTGELQWGTASVRPESWKQHTPLFDLRLLGITAQSVSVLRESSFESTLLGNQALIRNRLEFTGNQREKMGIIESVISPSELYPSARPRKLTIACDRGPSLVKISKSFTNRENLLRDELDVTLGQFDGIWFPEQVRYQRYVNDNPGPLELVTLSQVRINQPVAEELFSMSALQLQPGDEVLVYTREPSVLQHWNGTQLVDLEDRPRATLTTNTAAAPTADWRQGWIWLNVLFGCGLAGYAWRTRSQQRQSSQQPGGERSG